MTPTEPGWYWQRYIGNKQWRVAQVAFYHGVLFCEGRAVESIETMEWVGPLEPPKEEK